MNIVLKGALKSTRAAWLMVERRRSGRPWTRYPLKDIANQCIRSIIEAGNPALIARLGSNEAQILANYYGVKRGNPGLLRYVRGDAEPWWWEKKRITQLVECAGFFPAKNEAIEKFCQDMDECLAHIDVLGSWLHDEEKFSERLVSAKRYVLEDLEPFFAATPWTHALRGKRVVVVHPFAQTILSQAESLQLIHPAGFMPEINLRVVASVQSIGGRVHGAHRFADWFEARDYMFEEVMKEPFDIAILGCGAYGLSLAKRIKTAGKIALHLGGVTQLLFGIIGARWEKFIVYPYTNLFNEFWVRPDDSERPPSAARVEGACYW